MTLKALTAAALVVASMPLMPTIANAQVRTEEEKQAEYDACYNEYVSRGFPEGQAYSDCYNRVYGTEGGPSGEPNTYPRPAPGRDCWGSYSDEYCNPYEQPE